MRGILVRDPVGVVHVLVAASDRHEVGRGYSLVGGIEGAAVLASLSDAALVELGEQLGSAWARCSPAVLRARLVDELRQPDSRLVLLRARTQSIALSLEDVAAAPRLSDLAESEQEFSWVAVRLVGLDGQPLAGITYELTLADGSTESGTTDANGEGRHEGIVRGSCIVTFQGLEPTLWQRAQAESR